MQAVHHQIMSTQSQNSDAFAIYKQNVQKYFENVSKLTPQYFQSATELQNECMKTCQKTIDAAVSMHQEFAKKSGINTEIPGSAKTAIVDTNKQFVQANTVNNQLVKTTIDATVQNFKTFNDNVNAFAELNKNIIQTWINPFTQTK
jgi:thiaminase